MKYKVGDRVIVKSSQWYNDNKNECDSIHFADEVFTKSMSKLCGQVVTITTVADGFYIIKGDVHCWIDDMFEGLADAREVPVEHPCDWLKRGFNLPDGYEFQDENGNVINTIKITLIKKQLKFPTTYEECCKVLGVSKGFSIVINENISLYHSFIKLKRCRDAYWKIAGDWKPDWKKKSDNYNLIVYEGDVIKDINCGVNHVLSFPTEEMRDAFYDNFKDLIEQCKELL